MIKGFGNYNVRGGSIRAVETAYIRETRPASVARSRAPVSNALGRTKEQANTSMSASSSALGGITHEDLSLSYIGGSASRNTSNTYGAPPEVYNYYAAIFREDSVCGAAVELRANLPYAAGFRTSGTSDPKRLKVYQDAISGMRMESMFSRISIDRDSMGAFFGVLDFNTEKKTFDSILPLSRLDVTRILYSPVNGMDPVVNTKPPQTIIDLVAAASDTRTAAILKCIPEFLKAAQGASQGVPVPSENLVWIARPHPDPRFNSIYHRILPVFLIERALTRGTIDGAHKRQKPILHITMGQGEEWAPSPEEMGDVSDLFNNADADPMGAIVTTRDGISVSEVRSPSDFWKITDIADQTLAFKLRALGVSEAFLSADASFANADSAVTVFIEGLRAERSQLEKQVFYDKLFPQIATANSFFLKGKSGAGAGSGNSLNSITDISSLDIPVVEWRRSLQPEGDGAYMDLLTQLETAGVPLPIRMFAAAGGVDLEALLAASDQDFEDRKKIAAWKDKIKELAPEVDEGAANEFASLLAGVDKTNPLAPMGILNRDYGDHERYDFAPLDGRGRRQPASRKWKLDTRDSLHRMISRVTASVAAKENHHARERGLLV